MPITPLRKRFRSSKMPRKTRAVALQAMKMMTLTMTSMITSKKYTARAIKRIRLKVIKLTLEERKELKKVSRSVPSLGPAMDHPLL